MGADNNFFVTVPITLGQDGLKEVYPNVPRAMNVGNGFRCWFDVPEGAKSFRLGYQGRSWPLRMDIFDPAGNVAATDTWVGSDDPLIPPRWLECAADARQGWSFSLSGYGLGGIWDLEIPGRGALKPFYFSAARDKLFAPTQ